jgi:Pvc16 N-terminal domain
VIHEVDEALRGLLAESGLEASGVEIVLDAPTRDWAARRNAPTVCAFLYDIREDPSRRGSGAGEVYDADGHVVARRTPPRWFELTYLVTAWASRPQDEHRLLSQVLATLVAVDALPERLLTGSLAELGLTVSLDTAGAGPDGPSASDVWSALGGELKASLGVRVRAPLAGASRTTAPPVTEGLVVRATDHRQDGTHRQDTDQRQAGDPVPGRRLRYEGVSDPGPDGFAGPRERRPAPARRRRGGRQP